MIRMTLALLLLLAAPAAAQVQDTARATAELAISFEPGSIVVRGDTTLVYVGVAHEGDTLMVNAVDRASLALQAAILSEGMKQESGPPTWFWGGVLVVAAGAVLAFAFKEERVTTTHTYTNINNYFPTGGQATDTTTVVTTITRFPWCWPPGHCKRDREDEDE